jgi:hypothetical protein
MLEANARNLKLIVPAIRNAATVTCRVQRSARMRIECCLLSIRRRLGVPHRQARARSRPAVGSFQSRAISPGPGDWSSVALSCAGQ